MKFLNKYIPQLLPWIMVVAMGILLLIQHTDLLFKSQEQSLFLPTSQFFEESTDVPGGWLTYSAAFLTQFFYYPALGILILVAMWAATIFLVGEGTKLESKYMGLTALIPVALCACIAQTGYWIYVVKLQGVMIVPTLGALFIALLLYVSTQLKGIFQTIFVGVVAIAGYPLMGAYGILAAIVLAIYSENIIKAGITATICALVSCLLFYYSHATVMMTQMAYTALPCLTVSKQIVTVYAIPYVCLVVGLFLPLLVRLRFKENMKMYVSCALGILSIVPILACNYNNNNFRRELKITRAMEKSDWYEVLNIIDDSKSDFNPTREIVFARNLALWRVGKLGDYAFSYNHELVMERAPYPVSTQQVCGAREYFYSGLITSAYRWAMETCIGYGWDVEGLKYLSRCSIINGEYALAQRYLNLLKQTMFHSDWADYYYQMTINPELIKKDKELAWLRSLITYSNSLVIENGMSAENVYTYYANCEVNNSSIQEMGIISAMMLRDSDMFWKRFVQYISINRNIVDVPKHYQEAALFLATIEDKEELLNQPFSEQIKQKFDLFQRYFVQYDKLPQGQRAALMNNQFGRTYYYYYLLNRVEK